MVKEFGIQKFKQTDQNKVKNGCHEWMYKSPHKSSDIQ